MIAELVGWTRPITVFRERVTQLRPLFAPADPESRTTYAPGELAKSDLWFPPVDIPVGVGQVARPPATSVQRLTTELAEILRPSRRAPSRRLGA